VFGISLNPLHYALVGSLLINLILGGYSYVSEIKLSDCRASQRATEVLGEAQEKEAKRLDKISKRAKKKADEEYNRTINDLRIYNDRLRKQVASTKHLPTTSQVCTGGNETTEVDWPFIESEIQHFRNETRRLIEEGDREKAGLDATKEWDDSQSE
jgi:hypothetical protein